MNPWAQALVALRVSGGAAPRKSSAWQVWARDNRELIDKAIGADAQIGQRNKIASQLFKEEPDEIRQEMEEKAKREQAEAVKRYKDSLTGAASKDPAEQKK